MTTIDKILAGCACFIIIFTIVMIVLFCVFQSVPDTLIDAVFGLFSAEAVITFVIWWVKKKQSREDRK